MKKIALALVAALLLTSCSGADEQEVAPLGPDFYVPSDCTATEVLAALPTQFPIQLLLIPHGSLQREQISLKHIAEVASHVPTEFKRLKLAPRFSGRRMMKKYSIHESLSGRKLVR